MYYFEPIVIASIVLAAIGGYFVGRLFSVKFLGGCFTVAAGLCVVGILIFFFMNGYSRLAAIWTNNLGWYIAHNFLAFIAFIFTFVIGISHRKRNKDD